MNKEIQVSYKYFEDASQLTELEGKLFRKACEARENAYAPYSKFHVGCAVLLKNGEIFCGNNQENAAYPSGICAERATIFWVSSNFPNEEIEAIFVVGGPQNPETAQTPTPPCGACRQSLLEYESKQPKKIPLYFANISGETYRVDAVSDLLPFSFDSSFL